MVNITINGEGVSVPAGISILEAAKQVKINIPHLCYLEGLEEFGACRLCVVELEGEPRLTPSCVREVAEGMKIHTNTGRVRRARRTIIELLLANHNVSCPTCERNETCDLQKIAKDLGVQDIRFEKLVSSPEPDTTSLSIIRDPGKCILCGRCVRVCHDVQTVSAIGFVNRGSKLEISTLQDRGLGNVECVNCGQCIQVCPVGAIRVQPSVDAVWEALDNPALHVVVQEAPAVRVGLGDELGLEPGTLVAGKMHAALRKMGFDAVFDTNFTADLTIM